MKSPLNTSALLLAGTAVFGGAAFAAGADKAPAQKPAPAIVIREQAESAASSPAKGMQVIRVGRNPSVLFPFKIEQVTFSNGKVVLPRVVSNQEISFEGVGVGLATVTIWRKVAPGKPAEKPFVMAFQVKEALPSGLPFVTFTPRKPAFPVTENKQLSQDTTPLEIASVGTNYNRIFTFPSDVIDATYSDGAIFGAFAIKPRALFITGRSEGKAELVVRTRRGPDDTEGEIHRYAITVVKAPPSGTVIWGAREESLEGELAKRDERIRELERQLVEKQLAQKAG